MTVGALLSALIVGVVMGALGRQVIPGRHPVPRWVTAAVGVVAALLGSVTARLAGADAGRFTFREVLVQVCAAGVAVVLVVVTSGRHRSTTPPTGNRSQEGPAG